VSVSIGVCVHRDLLFHFFECRYHDVMITENWFVCKFFVCGMIRGMEHSKFQIGNVVSYLAFDSKPRTGTVTDIYWSYTSNKICYMIVTMDGCFDHTEEPAIFRVEVDLVELNAI